ncbi:hypothetical protein JCM16814_15020 [Desulfobaculum senezii]|jgi:hypothetical protein
MPDRKYLALGAAANVGARSVLAMGKHTVSFMLLHHGVSGLLLSPRNVKKALARVLRAKTHIWRWGMMEGCQNR